MRKTGVIVMLRKLSSLALAALLVSAAGMQASAQEEATKASQSPVVTAPVYYYDYAAPLYFDPYGLGQLEFALADSAAMRDFMDRESAWHLSLMDNQRRWMDSLHDWHRAQSDAWFRWVDPWGAAHRDWMDARQARIDALFDADRDRGPYGRYSRYYDRTPENVAVAETEAATPKEEESRAK
jgi:hypothetical protein